MLFVAWLVFVSLFMAAFSFGEPFLVCDPYTKEKEQPTGFSVVAGKLTFSDPAEKLHDGSVRLKFDLRKLPDGEHRVEIKAVNEIAKTESESVSVQILKKEGQAVILTTPQTKPEKEKDSAFTNYPRSSSTLVHKKICRIKNCLMAEVHGNRTHPPACDRYTGFEDQEAHQAPWHFHSE